jgi:MerR family transcriptional regulator, light-induced transcriptional regulator
VKGDRTTQSAHGRYRIQTVAELTGVPASTLRAWEQRYGFPSPQRTASAYRLYTDADVARIVRVRALCDSGMAAAEAVTAVMLEASAAPSGAGPSSVAGGPRPGSHAAMESADVVALDVTLRGALLMAPPAAALDHTIEPQWLRMRAASLAGRLDRAEHRIVVEVFGHVARDVMRMGQPTQPHGVALLGGFGDDDDLLPLCRIALGCHARQVRTISLGPRCTAGVLADATQRFSPRLVGLACVEPPPPSRARELLDDLWRAVAGCPLVVYGPGIEGLPVLDRDGLHLVGDAETLAELVTALC